MIYCLYLTYLFDHSEHAPFYDHYKAKKSTPTLLSNSQTLIQRPCKETKKRQSLLLLMQASCIKRDWRTTPLYFQNSIPWDKLRKLKYNQQITARFEASTHVEFLRSLESSILQLLNHWSSDSVGWITCGPQIGKRPLHLVFAFWRAALSHSSRPRASLLAKTTSKIHLIKKIKQ